MHYSGLKILARVLGLQLLSIYSTLRDKVPLNEDSVAELRRRRCQNYVCKSCGCKLTVRWKPRVTSAEGTRARVGQRLNSNYGLPMACLESWPPCTGKLLNPELRLPQRPPAVVPAFEFQGVSFAAREMKLLWGLSSKHIWCELTHENLSCFKALVQGGPHQDAAVALGAQAPAAGLAAPAARARSALRGSGRTTPA